MALNQGLQLALSIKHQEMLLDGTSCTMWPASCSQGKLSRGEKVPRSFLFYRLPATRAGKLLVGALISPSLPPLLPSAVILMKCELRALPRWGSCSSDPCAEQGKPVKGRMGGRSSRAQTLLKQLIRWFYVYVSPFSPYCPQWQLSKQIPSPLRLLLYVSKACQVEV